MNIDIMPHAQARVAVPARAAADGRTSILGVVLLSAMAVALTIVGVLLLGAVMVGSWWLVVHIPVPPAVARLWAEALARL